MTRRRSSAPGREHPDRPRSLPDLVAVLALAAIALLAAACGGPATSEAPPGTAATPSVAAPSESVEPSDEDASLEPSEAASEEPSLEPSEEASEEPSEAPSDEASAEPSEAPIGSSSAGPTPTGGSAGLCAGNADNRDFYASVADAVDWAVYCPVLPSGWFVESGSYRLAGGGRMEIGYKGSSGRHILLREGSFCTDGSGCVPGGSELGDAPFGDQTGSLVATSNGGWAIVVAPGARPSWLLTGSGMDEEAFRQIAADLMVVGG